MCLARALFFVFDEETGVFDYEKALCVSFRSRGFVGDALLEPEGFGFDGDGGIGDGGNVFGAAEDVDNVDGMGDVLEAGVGYLAKYFGFVGIDGDDAKAGALEIAGNFVAGAGGIRGEANDGDGFGVEEKVCDGI